MSPQPSSFVGYIENYGIKLWRPFKQQYSMGRNGHRPKWYGPKWSWTKMVMGRNDPESLYTQYIKKRNTCIFADNLSNFKDVHFKLAGYID